jgi:Concanavalin A-like lectin/glucanases superfamily
MLGVAHYALWAAGCALKPAAEPISRWELDEISSAEGVFEDRGPAHVLMVHAGDWADLTTGSLVVGDDDTSAYTDGSAYATLPANVAAHNLAALTISLYYQRTSATHKHILLAAGDSSAAGDFSLEVLPNGRLRAWHTGQDDMLRFFEHTNGITGTNLQVGTAHRIDLSLGPQGARLYLDGAELVAAAIPENLNGWNNARVKFLGRWTDGVQGSAVGVFDRIRIWNRQLTGAEIAALEAAQSISLPGQPGQPGDALSAPSLAEWLPSDEADPTPTKYVSNQARGNGSGSSPADAQEVQAALNGASPGDVLLAVCQTPGTIEFWDYPNGLSFPSGSAGSYITLQAREGDGVVISAGEDFAGARTPGSGFWTQSGLSQADIDKNIWRSAGTFSGGAQNMMGWWIEFDQPHQIIRASNLTNLRAPLGTADSPDSYAGPSVHKHTDGRVYIRFQRPAANVQNGNSKYSYHDKWSEQTWPGYPEAVEGGQIVYPLSQNPNDYVIHLTRVSSTSRAFNVGQWAKIGAGINSMGHRFGFSNGSAHLRLDRGLHYCWHSFNEPATSSNQISDVFCNRIRCTDGSKIHLSRAEWKFGGWLEPIRSGCWRSQNTAAITQLYCLDCTFGHWHEMIVGSGGWDQMRFRNCCFISGLDDGMQVPSNQSRIEFGYCYWLNSAWGGFGIGGDDGDPVGPLGNWFFHHNVVDCRQERCTDWMSEPHPGFMYQQHSPNGSNPIKFYNNLFIWGPDLEEEGFSGLAHDDSIASTASNTASGAANMHEVFNNILTRVHLEGTKRYDPAAGNNYSVNNQDPSDFAIGRGVRYSGAHTNELFDYNLYYRRPTMTSDPALRGWGRGSGQAVNNYATLAVWHASAEFEHSKLGGARRGAYAPGFDGNSTDVKPNLPSIDNYPIDRFSYRPAPTSAVTVASSGSLSGTNWWSTAPIWGDDYFPWNDTERGCLLTPDPWKGPLDPTGSTMPVGVQNP